MKERTDQTYSAETMAMARDLERLWLFRKRNVLIIECFWPSAKPPQPTRSGRCKWREDNSEEAK